MPAPVIRIDGIDKRFGSLQALAGVSFEVPEHCVFGLLGPNGAGKTTLFSIAANFLHADAGRIEVLGVDVRRISALRGRMSILPQDARFQRSIPIAEQLVFFRMLDGQDRQTAAREVRAGLEQVGLGAYARHGVHALSHGMLKRLGIAQAFLGHPEVILLDEPTAGLDPANARQIRDLVQSLRARATVVISSHNLAEIQELCSHVAIMKQGTLVMSGAVADMTRSGRELDIRLSRALDADALARLRALPFVASIATSMAADGPAVAAASASGAAASAAAGAALDYTFTLDLAGAKSTEPAAAGPAAADWDAAVAALLRALLDHGAVPRRMSEGRSLESHFLRVTEEGEVPDNDR